MKGFSLLWCQWIHHFVSAGSVAVKVNNEIGRYFQTKKGLRQGDPLSPILFNLVVDMLAIFIARAKEDGQLQGIIPHLINDGLKINFHKSELFCFGKANDRVDKYSQILGCGLENDRGTFSKKTEQLKRKTSIGDNHRKKYRLIKWGLLCLPKDQGGLEILNLEAQNTCLISKWLYKLINENGIWQQLLRKKYLKNKTIGEVFWKPGDSHFWSGLMKDKWLGNFTLKEQCTSLFNIARKKHVSVAHVFSTYPLTISFRRALVGDKLIKWNELVARIAYVQLDGHHGKAIWSLTKHGQFTVMSLYLFLVNQNALPLIKKLWKLKLPLKIKIFVWFLMRGVILTKDNFKKRNWNGDDRCCFCNKKETIQHLFFDCHVASFVWRIVHVAFGLKLPSNGYILDKVLEFTSKGGGQEPFEVGIPLVRDGGFRGVHQEWMAVI
ncbi:hypothetical protein U9M48_011977 [Paspalum notatum var. saurae]|uniref:Reverse transcriptase zinc-binding domain-containing protein n=1 Tax=Paspalum notatum var. saurae TaxID=547442 RepID=A0AAQ3SY53_PASNO